MSTIGDVNGVKDTTLEKDASILTELGDNPVWGDAGPLQQHEKETPDCPARELLTFDTNLHTVLGSQNLLSDDRSKVKVEASNPDHKTVFGFMWKANDHVYIPLNGQATVGFQLIGTWAGTISFTGSIDGMTWYAWSCRANIAATTVSAISSTGNGIWQANVAGLRWFRVQFTTYTSGTCQVILNATFTPLSHQTSIAAWDYGSQSTLLGQRFTTYELATHDSALREALFIPDTYNPNIIYYPGDVCTWNGRQYRCIAQTAVGVFSTYVPGTTYWQLDLRPSRAMVTRDYVSSPDATRLRIEHDLDAYQYRLQESMFIQQSMAMFADWIYKDYDLSLSQQYGGVDGKNYALGQSGMSNYTFEEIR